MFHSVVPVAGIQTASCYAYIFEGYSDEYKTYNYWMHATNTDELYYLEICSAINSRIGITPSPTPTETPWKTQKTGGRKTPTTPANNANTARTPCPAANTSSAGWKRRANRSPSRKSVRYGRKNGCGHRALRWMLRLRRGKATPDRQRARAGRPLAF